MPTLMEDYFKNPIGSLVTVRCQPWHVRDKIVLVGDACHAVVPFYGQGMNAAFEDVLVFNECVEEYGSDREQAFETYQRRRKKDVDTLADLAIANFLEMRDHTGSRLFLWKKRSEKWLHQLFPTWYIPLYTMVTFTRMPYGEAARRAKKQDRTVLAVLGLLLATILLLAVGL